MRTWDSWLRGIDHRDTEHTEIKGEKVQIPEHLNELCYRVIGAAIEVHRELGAGFHEAAYEEALVVEFALRSIPFERQVPVPVVYKGHTVANYRCDLIADCRVVVELKAIDSIQPVHLGQVLSYLKAGAYQVGLLINFNVPILKNGIRRLLWDL